LSTEAIRTGRSIALQGEQNRSDLLFRIFLR
jgi:hypothetical protein